MFTVGFEKVFVCFETSLEKFIIQQKSVKKIK